MGERFRETGRGGAFKAFGSNADAVGGTPPPLLTGERFSERMSQLTNLQREADKAPGAPNGHAVSSYIVVPDEDGGQKLQKVEPFNGDRAGAQNTGFVPDSAPVNRPNPSLGRDQASRPHHKGRTPNT